MLHLVVRQHLQRGAREAVCSRQLHGIGVGMALACETLNHQALHLVAELADASTELLHELERQRLALGRSRSLEQLAHVAERQRHRVSAQQLHGTMRLALVGVRDGERRHEVLVGLDVEARERMEHALRLAHVAVLAQVSHQRRDSGARELHAVLIHGLRASANLVGDRATGAGANVAQERQEQALAILLIRRR